jgi:eukaryotic-like serine/threonine-protein kinase
VTSAPVDVFGLVGQILDGHYRVDAVVGEGGHGIVYKGWHVAFEQPIAIKALKMPDVTNVETRIEVLTHFREEAKLLYKLSQACLSIVRCIGYGAVVSPTQAWAPYLVLEWLEGCALSDDLAERRKRHARGGSLDETLDLLAPIAKALAYAHSQRVAHRDVKPANVFLMAQGGPKLLDFGIAKVMDAGATAANAQHTTGGPGSFTPYYAAPEQLDPRLGRTGPWTDVYGFALVLSETLSDRAPISGTDLVSVITQSTDSARRPTPRFLGATTPDAVETAFQKALAIDPKARFADVGTFWEALMTAGRLGVTGRPGWVAPSGATVPLATPFGGHSSVKIEAAPHSPPRHHGHAATTLEMSPAPPAAGTGGAPRVTPISGSSLSGGPPAQAAASANPPAPRRLRRHWKLALVIACLLALSMVGGAYLASQY